jgi:hypothetical protein
MHTDSQLVDRLVAFIIDARDRASGSPDPNLRMSGLSRLTEGLRRLYVLLDDYQVANDAFFEHHNEWMASLAAHTEGNAGVSRELGPDEMALLEQGRDVHLKLHLRIDAFYVFAKVLLDDIGKAIQEFFGHARGLPIGKSHSQLQANLFDYAAELDLTDPTPLLSTAGEGDPRITDYRDKQDTHRQNVRTMKATVWSNEDQLARIGTGMLLPKDTDKYPESEAPPGLLEFIERYVDEVLSYIEANEPDHRGG